MTPILAESIYWHFPVLLATVSLVYGATRYERWPDILREAGIWGFRMAFFLVSIGLTLWLIPMLPVWLGLTVGGVVAAVFAFNAFRGDATINNLANKKKT